MYIKHVQPQTLYFIGNAFIVLVHNWLHCTWNMIAIFVCLTWRANTHTHTHVHTYTITQYYYTSKHNVPRTFQDGPSRSALYLLASYLPKRNVSSISKGTLVALSSLRYPVKSQDYTSLLVALVAWQQTAHVIKLTNQWLDPQLNWQVEGLVEVCKERDENCTRNTTHPKRKVRVQVTVWYNSSRVTYTQSLSRCISLSLG